MCWYYQRFLLCHALKSLQFGAVTTSWLTTLYNARMHTLILVYKNALSISVYQMHMEDTWLRILSDTAFKIHIYSFENIIMSNINGLDTLKMECYERIIFLHIVTRFCWIKWRTICVDILNICMLSYSIIFIQRIVTSTTTTTTTTRERCIQIGICFHFRYQVYLLSLKAQLLEKCWMM